MAFMTRDRGPLPPVILLLSIGLQIALHKWLPVTTVLPAPWHWIGALFIVCGAAVMAGPVLSFHRRETTIVPFQESSALVTEGMYRYTRNPMYVSMVLILIGVAALTGSLSPFAVPLLFVPVLNARVIRHEEAMLEERFGDVYREYCRRVRRWL